MLDPSLCVALISAVISLGLFLVNAASSLGSSALLLREVQAYSLVREDPDLASRCEGDLEELRTRIEKRLHRTVSSTIRKILGVLMILFGVVAFVAGVFGVASILGFFVVGVGFLVMVGAIVYGLVSLLLSSGSTLFGASLMGIDARTFARIQRTTREGSDSSRAMDEKQDEGD